MAKQLPLERDPWAGDLEGDPPSPGPPPRRALLTTHKGAPDQEGCRARQGPGPVDLWHLDSCTDLWMPQNLPNLIAPTLWQLSDYGGGITSQSWRLLLYKTPRVVPNAHGSVGFEGALLFALLMVPTQLRLLWVRAFTSCHGLPAADSRKACCCSNTRVNAALKLKIEIIDIEALMEAKPGALFILQCLRTI